MSEDLRKWTDEQLTWELNERDRLRRMRETTEEKRADTPPTPEGFPVVCSECGKNTTVPFKPRQGWPVYCMFCYTKRQEAKK